MHVDVYAIQPGDSQPVGPLISVHGHPHDIKRRSILLTDVFLTQLTALQWVIATIHPVHEQLVSSQDLTGPDIPASELVAQGYLEMYDSQNDAKVAAMRALNLDVSGVPAGATVVAIGTNASARGTLEVADRIIDAGTHAVRSQCELFGAMAGVTAGTNVTMSVERAVISPTGTITYRAAAPVSVKTEAVPTGLEHELETLCPTVPPPTAWMGIEPENATTWHFPVSVSINTANIGGPSAGLAMTLGVIDALTPGSLTGHVKIAATGTIDASGNVGDVGGVAEKTIAVENAGGTVFLVPDVEVGTAKAAASGSLKVIGVSSLSEALAAIEQVGGSVPAAVAEPAAVHVTS